MKIITQYFTVAAVCTSALTASLAQQAASQPASSQPSARLTLPPLKGQKADVLCDLSAFFDKDGKPLKASDIQGKYVLIYGGYPECTGICPGAASALVEAMQDLKSSNPELAKDILPIVVIIQNEKGQDVKQRARDWETQGLDGKKTGIRVLTTEDETALKQFRTAFSMDAGKNENDKLVHTPWAYLFGKNGRFAALVQTQDGGQVVSSSVQKAIKDLKPSDDQKPAAPSGP